MATGYAEDALVLKPYTFHIATQTDADPLLKSINDCYRISQEFMCVPNTVRTNIKDVTDICQRGLRHGDMYIVMKSRETQEILASMRYEPTVEMVTCKKCDPPSSSAADASSDSPCCGCADTTTNSATLVSTDNKKSAPSYAENITNSITLSYDELFTEDLFKMFTEDLFKMFTDTQVFNPFDDAALEFPQPTTICNKITDLVGGGGSAVAAAEEGEKKQEQQEEQKKKFCLYTIAYFSQFCTHVQHQGKGYGSILLQFVQDFTQYLADNVMQLFQRNATDLAAAPAELCIDNSCVVMKMVVLSPREDMVRFYVKRGYQCTSVLPAEEYMKHDILPQFAASLVMIQYELVLPKKTRD